MPVFSLSATHPEYGDAKIDWVLMHDAYKGQRRIKSKGPLYLPYTQSQILDGAKNNADSTGGLAYQAYKMRARFPNFVREAVQNAIGMMHSRDAKITLPESMKNIKSSRFIFSVRKYT